MQRFLVFAKIFLEYFKGDVQKNATLTFCGQPKAFNKNEKVLETSETVVYNVIKSEVMSYLKDIPKD